jgi:hypothetical protein
MAKKQTDNEKLIEEINEFRKQAADYWADIHNQYTADIKFSRKGEQWDEKAKRAREIDGRPALTFNKIPSFMRQVTNESRMNKPAIVVKPQDDGADVETAKILTGMVRAIESNSNSDYAYDTAIDNTVAGGLGYIIVTTDYIDDMSFEQDVKLKRVVNPLSVKFDPMSIEPDGSDQMQCFIEDIVREEVFEQMYPDADMKGLADSKIDKPEEGVLVGQYWKVMLVDDVLLLMADGSAVLKSDLDTDVELQTVYMGVEATDKSRPIKRRKVCQYITNGYEILEKREWAGKYIPVIPVYGEEVWDGDKRCYKSIHRDAQDAQRMYNYFRTSSTESVALQIRSPYLGKVGTFDTDISKWQNANTVNYPFIEYDNEIPQRQGWTGVDQGSLQEAMNASEDMKAIMGIYDASLGNRSNETSGVAIAQRKSQSGTATYHFADNLSRSIRQCGRIIVDLIPKIYDTPRMVRILGEDGKTAEMVGINQPTEYLNRVQMFDVRSGKYDVAVDTGASFTTRREEVAAQIGEVIRAYPQGAPMLMDVLAENSDWPKADKVAKRFAAMLPQQIIDSEQDEGQEVDPQVQQMGQQLQQAEQAIDQLKQMLAESQQKTQDQSAMIDLEKQREINKGKLLDLQKQKQITDQKEAEALLSQLSAVPDVDIFDGYQNPAIY